MWDKDSPCDPGFRPGAWESAMEGAPSPGSPRTRRAGEPLDGPFAQALRDLPREPYESA